MTAMQVMMVVKQGAHIISLLNDSHSALPNVIVKWHIGCLRSTGGLAQARACLHWVFQSLPHFEAPHALFPDSQGPCRPWACFPPSHQGESQAADATGTWELAAACRPWACPPPLRGLQDSTNARLNFHTEASLCHYASRCYFHNLCFFKEASFLRRLVLRMEPSLKQNLLKK